MREDVGVPSIFRDHVKTRQTQQQQQQSPFQAETDENRCETGLSEASECVSAPCAPGRLGVAYIRVRSALPLVEYSRARVWCLEFIVVQTDPSLRCVRFRELLTVFVGPQPGFVR